MNQSAYYPSVRLAVAGYVTLVLLAWIGFVPGATPSLQFTGEHPVRILITTLCALLILLTLAPVLGRGPAHMRWLALLLCLFPALIMAMTGLWTSLTVLFR
jgi:hypothetical protein